jgi:isoaspartyl peptidase/L-asparaginase-like protein (Ntn-hydrolase superfamily)
LVGCGGYANEYGAAAACGHGESIIRMTVAKEVVSNMQKLNQSAQVRLKNFLINLFSNQSVQFSLQFLDNCIYRRTNT